jgi:hypothetical protein
MNWRFIECPFCEGIGGLEVDRAIGYTTYYPCPICRGAGRLTPPQWLAMRFWWLWSGIHDFWIEHFG